MAVKTKPNEEKPRRTGVTTKLRPGFSAVGFASNIIAFPQVQATVTPPAETGEAEVIDAQTEGSLAVAVEAANEAFDDAAGTIGSDHPTRPKGVDDKFLLDEWLRLHTPVSTVPGVRGKDGVIHRTTYGGKHKMRASTTDNGARLRNPESVHLVTKTDRKGRVNAAVRVRLLVDGKAVYTPTLVSSMSAEQYVFECFAHQREVRKSMDNLLMEELIERGDRPYRPPGSRPTQPTAADKAGKAVVPDKATPPVAELTPPWEADEATKDWGKKDDNVVGIRDKVANQTPSETVNHTPRKSDVVTMPLMPGGISLSVPRKAPVLTAEETASAKRRRYFAAERSIREVVKLDYRVEQYERLCYELRYTARSEAAYVQRLRLKANRMAWFMYTSAESMIDDGYYQELMTCMPRTTKSSGAAKSSSRKTMAQVFGHVSMPLAFSNEFLTGHFRKVRDRRNSRSKLGSPISLETTSLKGFETMTDAIRRQRRMVSESMSSLDRRHADQNYRWYCYRRKVEALRRSNTVAEERGAHHFQSAWNKGTFSTTRKWVPNLIDPRGVNDFIASLHITSAVAAKRAEWLGASKRSKIKQYEEYVDNAVKRTIRESDAGIKHGTPSMTHGELVSVIRNTDYVAAASGLLLPKWQGKEMKELLTA